MPAKLIVSVLLPPLKIPTAPAPSMSSVSFPSPPLIVDQHWVPPTDIDLADVPEEAMAALAELLAAESGRGSFELKEFPPERKRIDIGDYYCDDRRLRETVGWEPRVSLQEGLRRSVAFYREHLAHFV